ncbi:DUF6879 family protein [Nocardiopsis sp. CNT312]|uniref:DUF6879 family protein n=1 Tax=Nocardiopsis sp. CNT312 TaxID=1137268 RepID=UPI0004921E25|nr:DUF6879 family protein [Nocardiopsis sp. CNT312]
MLDTLADRSGALLGLEAYEADFDRRFEALRGTGVWKLERLQDFHQPENPSWMLYRAGDVPGALRLLEQERPALSQMFTGLERRGVRVHRVRVVQWPLTPYLHWELCSLRIRAQCGERVRVVGPEAVAHLERAGPLPEVLTLGSGVAYRIRYDRAGVLAGSVRHTDAHLVASCRARIVALYREGEPLESFFAREIAPVQHTPRP